MPRHDNRIGRRRGTFGGCRLAGALLVLIVLAAVPITAQPAKDAPERPTPTEASGEVQPQPVAQPSATQPATESAANQENAAADDILLEEEEPVSDFRDQVPDMSRVLAKFVLAMVVVVALLVVGLMGYQKLTRRGFKLGRAAPPGGGLHIVDKLSLGPKQWVCLLNACGRYLVLGVAEKEISVLMELTFPEETDGEQSFTQTLQGLEIPRNLTEKARPAAD